MLSFYTISLACISKPSSSESGYIVGNKYFNADYLNQLERMEKCLQDLPAHIYKRTLQLRETWTVQAFSDVRNKLKHFDQQILIKRGFIDCIRIVAESNANKFICKAFVINPGENNLLYEYALLEYEECIRRKNEPYIKQLTFEMPNIGINA
ncbi:hypothetical protein COBT_001213 [Conglomerata obtusa]